MRRSSKLKVGYFAQHQQDELDLAATPLQLMQRLKPQGNDEPRRAHLARFGIGVGKADTRVAQLSGGEKARLLFALMTHEKPHVLLLDEPTNHLDVDAREALVQALNDYEGAVVLVSHDPHLIELTADRLWLVADGRCQGYEGDLEDYRRLLLEHPELATMETLASWSRESVATFTPSAAGSITSGPGGATCASGSRPGRMSPSNCSWALS